MTTPKGIARGLWASLVLVVVMQLVDNIFAWGLTDNTTTVVWTACLFAAARVCSAIQLVWEKLPEK